MIDRTRIYHHKRVLNRTRWNTHSHPNLNREDYIYRACRCEYSVAWTGNDNVIIKWINDYYFWAWTETSPVALKLRAKEYIPIKCFNGKTIVVSRWSISVWSDPNWIHTKIVEIMKAGIVRDEMRFCSKQVNYIRDAWTSHLNYYRSREKMIEGHNSNCEKYGNGTLSDWGSSSALFNRREGCHNLRHLLKRRTREIIEEELID